MSIYSEFLQKIKRRGLATPNRYRIFLQVPNGVVRSQQEATVGGLPSDFFNQYGATLGGDQSRTLSMLCESAQLPGKLITTTDQHIHGPTQKLPYHEVYADMPLTFIITNDMLPKRLFDAWQATIVDPRTRNLNFYKEYVTNIDIEQLDKEELPIYKIRLHEAYPVSVDAMTLDHNSTDQIQKLTVTLAYRYWEPISTTHYS